MTTPLPPPSAGVGSLYSPPGQQLQLASLRASPIAHFASTPNDGYGHDGTDGPATPLPASGRLLSVNSRYVAYAVKKGLVRIIDRDSAAKTLLRGHDESSRLVDASFFGGAEYDATATGGVGVSGLRDELVEARRRRSGGSAASTPPPPAAAAAAGSSDVLATVGGMRDRASVLIWRLRPGRSKIDAEKLLEVRLGGVGASVVAWHPFDPNSFLLLHRNVPGSEDDHDGGGGGGGRAIATLVNIGGLRTRRDDAEGHAVWERREGDGGGREGMRSLVVPEGARGTGTTTGANDVAWWSGGGPAASSSSSSSFALTGHDDGCVRLWDAGSPRGAVVPCAATLDVVQSDVVDGGTTPSSRRVTRVLFLDQYVDPASCEGRGGAVAIITPPFVVGTDMNHTVAIWSSFRTSAGGGVVPPTRLRVFGLRRDGVDLSSASRMMSLEICPAPYRPPSPHVAPGFVDGGGKEGEDDVAPPSSFVLMAERDVGVMHALHIDTEWAEGRDGDVTVAVAGFDYVTTLNVVYPVYSFCVAPQQAAPGRRSLAEERDVDLCCLQSKAVQMLTLAAGMCAPPAVEGGTYRGSLAPGITLLGSSALAESCDGGDDGGDEDADEEEEEEEDEEEDEDEDEDEDYEDYDEEGGDVGEKEFEKDYEVEEDGLDSGNEDDRESDAAAPAATTKEPDSFSNWLCSIAIPSPSPSAAAAAAIAAPPKEALRRTVSTGGTDFPSVMPPTPFLLPDQVLSFSGSESDMPVAKREAPSKSIVPVPPDTSALDILAATASPPLASKPSKKSNKKSGQDGAKKAQAFPSNQPSAPVKILLRQEPNQEPAVDMPPLASTTTADTLAAPVVGVGVSNTDLGAVEAAVQRAIASQMRSHEMQLLSLLKEAISTEVASAVRSSFKDADNATSQVVQRGVASGLSSGLGASLDKNGKLGRMVEKVARESAASAAKEAVGSMQPLIMNSLNQTMREVMIPAYEAATRQMFEQTSMSLEQGLAQMSMNQTNVSAPALQAMSNQMTNMSEGIQLLSVEVARLRRAVDASGASQTNGNVREIQDGTSLSLGIRDEIAALCQAQRYDEAFTKAVSASDGDLVLYACKKADVEAVFNGEVSISQPIMICLLQQLGAVLVPATDAGDIKTILKWLQEIAVTIDPSNINIQRHVGGVVQQLLANINTKMSNCDPVFRRPMQMLVQVIRGLL